MAPRISIETPDSQPEERLFPMASSPQVAQSSKSGGDVRNKVRLAPKHSAMHWESFKKSNNVKNIDPSCFPIRIDKHELSKHNSLDDCWVALGGKVYNITDYLDYHPGGVEILKKVAGKECTAMFMKYHRWVNFERILDECFLGFLV